MKFTPCHFPEIDSTNSAALREIQHGSLPSPTVYYATHQTAGRGTRGRSWQGKEGNVMATFAFPLRGLPNPHLLVYAIALAVAETVRQFAPYETVQVKWPNDILLNGEKIAGALHETAYDGIQTWFLAGIGLNVTWSPPASETFHPATHVCAYTPTATMKSVLDALTAHLEKALTHWPETPWGALKRNYLSANAHSIGEEITLTPHSSRGSQVRGKFQGLDSDGALVLETPDGVQTFQTADIFPDLPAA